MSEDSAKLATLIGSRLCHDLVSPVGAIANGLELVALAGSPGPEEMSLISDSCHSATARINFFRVAFGHAGGEQMIGRREATKLLADFCGAGRLSADWQAPGDVPRPDVQLAFLAFLCCESALPQGGKVQIAQDGGGWTITGTGPRVTVDTGLWEHLDGAPVTAELAPSRVQFPLLALLAGQGGRRLSVRSGAAAVTIGFA